MKKINLIGWLWKDSHEKQKVRSVRRYAAMLIMLLTLGVGQMWAETLHVRGYADWGDVTANTMSGSSSPWTFSAYWSTNGEFKIHNGTNWYGSPASSGAYQLTFGTEVTLTKDGGENMKFPSLPSDGGRYLITVRKDGTAYKLKVVKEVEEGSTAYSTSSSPYVYFNVAAASSAYTSAAILLGKSDGSQDYAMSGKISGTQLFYKQMPDWSGYKTFLFINSNSWDHKWNGSKVTERIGSVTNTNAYNTSMTGNYHMFTVASGDDNASLTYTSQTTYSALLNKTQTIQVRISEDNGANYTNAANFAAWPGTINVTRTYLSSATASSSPAATAMTATTTTGALTSSITFTGANTTEYTFAGWSNSSSSPDGNTSKTYTITGASTKYAFYKRKQYTVSYGVCSTTQNGTISLNSGSGISGSSSSTLNHGTSISFTASPSSSSYVVEGWYSTAACNTTPLQEGGTTYDAGTLTAATTVYVKFKERDGGVITLTAGSNGKVSSDNSSFSSTATISAVKVAGDQNIYAQADDGYQFSTWTRTTGTGTIKTNAASGVYTAVAWEDAELTASFTETMRTITIVGGTVYGGVATSTTAGVATSAKITANAPATGKKFTGWSLGDGVSLKGGYSETDRTIEIYSTADATVTATYADRASVKLYFAKPSGWTKVYAYAWKDGGTNNGWTANEMTSYETVGCVNYYYYLYYTEGDGIGGSATGNSAWNEVIFHNGTGGDGLQTADLALSNGHYYYKADAEASSGRASALASAWIVKGINGWGEADALTPNCGTNSASKSISITTGDKEFKIYNAVEDTWWRITADNVTATLAATTMNNNSNNMTLKPTVAGPYTFTVGSTNSTPTLAITYPTTYTVTFNAETFVNDDASHSTSTGGGTLSAVDGNSAALASGGKVISGGTAVITASKKDGYSFIGFYTSADCTTLISGAGVSISDNVLTLSSISGNKTVYAKFSENMTTVNLVASPTGKGTFTKDAATVTSVKAGKTTHPTVTAVAGSGYSVNTSATVWSESSDYISLSNTSTNPTTITATGTSGNSATLTATFTPNPYTITLNKHNGDDNVEISVTYDANTNLTSGVTPPTKTGYTFGGYYTSEGGSGTQLIEDDGDWKTGNSYINGSGNWVNAGNVTLHAKWTAKTTTISFSQTGTGYGSGGQSDTKTATYDAAMPTTISVPTAADGYAFMGYYDALAPLGTQYYTSAGASARNWDKEDATATLYAYFKKAEITTIALSDAVVEPSTSITATPTIDPDPEGTIVVCWEVQYSNGTPLPTQPTFNDEGENAVSFNAPAASATYILQAKLRLDGCEGTVLNTQTTTFQVAGEHDVTVLYKDASGNTIKASQVLEGIKPLDWSSDITAPTITGYTFSKWQQGDGVTIDGADGSGEKASTTIQIKANYDGTLTAVYTKKRMIYFYNTLGWENVYVYFYKDGTYWDASNGTGTDATKYNGSHAAAHKGQMLPIEVGSKIYYFDAEAISIPANYINVAFTEKQQDDCWFFYDGNNVVRRSDYSSGSLQMFVPLGDQTGTTMNPSNAATYFNNGYWMNYPENSGYTLKIYDNVDASKETGAIQSIAFPYSEDLKLPLKIDVELTDGYKHEYWFMVYRNDGTYLGNTWHYKQGYTGEQVISGGNNKSKITTSAPGNYTFTLTYHDNGSGTVNYYIDVDYPIASGDYRVYYSDNATWSQGAHTKDSWYHPSHSIAKATTEAKKDTVSFYIPKGDGISHTMKFQKVSVDLEGNVSWTDSVGGGITIPSSITESGIYNFIFSQPAGGATISLEKVEPYTGNFYIRTDCAGNTKWDSFKNLDHQMTYSDYADAYSGYSHYYAHWVTSGTNVKFVIANDYSMCISDTLIGDYGTTIANISNIGALNSADANIRFMWNQATNKISRAYIGGSSNISDRFLVLQGDAKMYDENGRPLTDAGGGKISDLNDYEMNLIDDQNFVYERTIQVNASARAKLTAEYNDEVQYFKGSAGAFGEGTTVQLLGGTYDAEKKYAMRIVYDFKTNRLVTAYVPSTTVEDTISINADLMIVREHQEEGQQLRFNEGALEDVKTVYGVMRFNRWTLNNKETTVGHSVVGDPKSAYERALYWISFPFDVNLSDAFGFGTYGTHWIIQEYNGAKRAAEGYWADSEGFWEYIWDRRGVTLKAGKGYVLALDLDLMKDNNTDFWSNNIEQVELFFPSTGNIGGISATNVTTEVESHECTIGPRPGLTDDRTKKDSHWNMIGIPSYANYGTSLKTGASGSVITWNENPETDDLPFLYEWNMVDDTYTVQSGTTYPFKSMHSYMVQYYGNLYWTLASATPASVARRTYAEKPQNVEMRLELSKSEKMVDQTFVKLSNDENVSAEFAFGEDLIKEFNANKANIYTFIGTEQVAGNSLPLNMEQTTTVSVGVKIVTNGDYTFSMPDGTEGIGVTLIDNVTGARTSLSALDYTIALTAGTYDNRFTLEISPVRPISTDLEAVTGDGLQVTGARKIMIDGILYIVKDGKMFDARGNVVK